MPVYLFTFHAYRSWMPHHPRGYTRRGEGYKEPDPDMAENYARRANADESVFDHAVQRALIEQTIESCPYINARLHGSGSDASHLHLLVSWSQDRDWLSVRKSLKAALTKRLNQTDTGVALSRGGSRKRVRNDGHFQYLMKTYLPGHRGVGWYEDRGWVEPR